MPAVEVHDLVEEMLKGEVGDLNSGGGECKGISDGEGLDHENEKVMNGSFVLNMEKNVVGDVPVENDCNESFVAVKRDAPSVELMFENGEDDCLVEGDINIGSSSNNEVLGQIEANQGDLGGHKDCEKQNWTVPAVESEPECEPEVLKEGIVEEIPKSQVCVLGDTGCVGKLAEPDVGKIDDHSQNNSNNMYLEEIHESEITFVSAELANEVVNMKENHVEINLGLTGQKEERDQESEVSAIYGLELDAKVDNVDLEESHEAQNTASTKTESIVNEETKLNSSPHVGQPEDSNEPQHTLQIDGMINKQRDGEENKLSQAHLEEIREIPLPHLVDVQETCAKKSDGMVQVEDNEDSKRICMSSTESKPKHRDFVDVEEGKSDSLGREDDLDSEIVGRDEVQIEGLHDNEASVYVVPLEESLGILRMNMKQNPELEPCPSDGIQLAREVVNHMVSIENGDIPPPSQIQDVDVGDTTKTDSILTAHAPDLNDVAIETKQDGSSDNAKSTPVHVGCEDVFVQNGDPVITSDSKKMGKPDNEGVFTFTAPLGGVHDMSLEIETENLDVISSNMSCSTDGSLVLGAVVLDTSLKTEPEKLDVKSSKWFSSVDEPVNVDGTHSVMVDTKSISAVTISGLDNNCGDQVISDVCLSPKNGSSPNDIEDISVVQVENSGKKPVRNETDTDCTDFVPNNEMLTSLEDSTVASSECQNVGDMEKRPLPLLIKYPYDAAENLKEQIKHAQLILEEKTKKRDAIGAELHKERAINKEYYNDTEAAWLKERAANDILRSKRQEIDAAQFLINKVKDAMDVEEIDSRLRILQHRIEHETVPLKEEKQLIREVKQLKQQREQICSNIGHQDELQQALDHKDKTKDRLKYMKKELDLLRDDHLKANTVVKAARKKQSEKLEKEKNLKDEYTAANEIQRNAYTQFQSLKNQLKEKTKYFWKYKDDRRLAYEYLFKGDKEAFQLHCANQVEEFMELWNKNDEFRKEYVRLNTRNTLRRLKTLDGRSLGPNEVPPVIPSAISASVFKENAVLVRAQEQEKPVVLKEAGKPVESVVIELKNQIAETENPVKASTLKNGIATVSGREEVENAREEENKLTGEEVEMARKAEELRKKEEAEKLKAQSRLKEKVKAAEAQERKKRIAEKAKARAALRAQKEAEEKEMEREKRAKKKERKKTAGGETAHNIKETESASSSETPENIEVTETINKPLTARKTVQRPFKFTKQTKAMIPPPIRNRGKRRMQMWYPLAVLLLGMLFLVGKFGF